MRTKRNRLPWELAASSLAVALSGCTLASDLDRFESAPLCTVSLELTGFNFHAPSAGMAGHTMTFRVVETPDDVAEPPSLRALAILDPTPAPDFDLTMPNAVVAADGPFEVDFFGDVDGSGSFTPSIGGIGEDHSWVLDGVCDSASIAFAHNTSFDAFSEPLTNTSDLYIQFANMPITSAALEVQLHLLAPDDSDEGPRTIGLYRLDAISTANPEVRLPGLIDEDQTVQYEVRIWADVDDDDVYDLGVDDSWIVQANGGELSTPLAFDYEARDGNREDIVGLLVTVH